MPKIIDFALIDRKHNKIFLQKRSLTRKLFPGEWEIPGGHLEDGETELQCIKRELKEETNLDLLAVYGKVHEFTWPNDPDTSNALYLIEATGDDLRIENGKVSEYLWASRQEARQLLQSSNLHTGLLKAFDMLETISSA